MADRPLDIESIFNEARQITDPTQRKAYLDRACNRDKALRARVERLLSAEVEVGDFLKTPAHGGADPGRDRTAPSGFEVTADSAQGKGITRPSDERGPVQLTSRDMADLSGDSAAIGTVIGPYKLLQVIGEGGFGTVYMAEQERPVRRRVALKVIKLGMDTRQVIARFEQERQALAIMDHPNIAKVLDAGATDTGRPYFVMELVKGVPITAYCDAHNLSPHDRLELFVSVCQAVQHAHQKGIIHRDIKPNNVLVSRHDDKPVVKVIDFGIAKATGGRLTEKTLFTEFRQMIGTPAYMSPEQAGLSDLDIDTRTDVYSLGVLLYELLTGTTPFDIKTLLSAGYAEIQRIIREVEPPTPSTRLSTMKDDLPSVAANRKTEPARLTRLVRGDLDWIVMKALEKDRARRYDTANGLAMDIERYLSGEPVIAAPPSASYRLRKFIKRNKGPVTAAGIVGAALVLGVIGTSVGLVVANKQRRIAEGAAFAESREKNRADARAAESEAVTAFLADMLAAVNPSQQSKDVTVRMILDQAAGKIGEQFKGKPLIEAKLRETIAASYSGLGDFKAANPHYRTALDLYKAALPGDDARMLRAMVELGGNFWELGGYDTAEQIYKAALEIQRRTLGEEHEDTIGAMTNLALLYQSQGRTADAEKLLLRAVDLAERVLNEKNEVRLGAMNNLALLYSGTGRKDKAVSTYERVLKSVRAAYPRDHPNTILVISNFAAALADVGRLDEALTNSLEALAAQRRVLGEDHPSTLVTMVGLGMLYDKLGKETEAMQMLEGATRGMRTKLGDDHPDTLRAISNLGSVYSKVGRYTAAEPLLAMAAQGIQKSTPNETDVVALALIRHGVCLTAMKRFDEAEPKLLKASELMAALTGPMDGRSAEICRALVGLYEGWERADPGKGHEAKSAEWRAKLNRATSRPTLSQPSAAPASRQVGGS